MITCLPNRDTKFSPANSVKEALSRSVQRLNPDLNLRYLDVKKIL